MAKVSGGSSGGSSSGWTPPSTPAGGLLVVQEDGSIAAKTDAELLAKSLQAQEGIQGGSVTGGAVTASEDGHTAQMTPESITFDTIEVTKEKLAGIEGSSVSAEDPAAAVSQIPAVSTPTGTGFRHVTSGAEDAAAVAGELLSPQAITPGGKLSVPHCHINTTGDDAFQLNSADKKIAFVFCPDVNYSLSSLSVFMKTIAVTGNMSLGLYDTTKGYVVDGTLNENTVSAFPFPMTSNTAPAPFAICLKKDDGTDVACSYGPYLAFSKTVVSGYYNLVASSAPSVDHPFFLGMTFHKAICINKVTIHAANTFLGTNIRTFSLWGSNVESPTWHTDDDWTSIGTATDIGDMGTELQVPCFFQNGAEYKHYRMKITVVYGAQSEMRCGEIIPSEAEKILVPNNLIQDLGTLDVGSSNGVWLRKTFDALQLNKNRWYAIVATGVADKDFSLSVRRVHSVAPSMPPYQCRTITSADAGATWTASYQDIGWQRATWNIVLNSTANHVPQLLYGSAQHGKAILHDGDATWALVSIPDTGIWLNCEALLFDVRYYIYLYNNAGTLALEASTTEPTIQDGIEVKTGDSTRLRVGQIVPIERQTGYMAPVMTPDRMLVSNLYNFKQIAVARSCPFAADTHTTLITLNAADQVHSLFSPFAEALEAQFLSEEGDVFSGFIMGNYQTYNVGITVDNRCNNTTDLSPGTYSAGHVSTTLTRGKHVASLVASSTAAYLPNLCKVSGRVYSRIGIRGTLTRG